MSDNLGNLDKLPNGWVAQWDEEYKRYYYVNKATGKSQWEFPTEEETNYSDNERHDAEQKSYQRPEAGPSEGTRGFGNGQGEQSEQGEQGEQSERGIGSFVMNQAMSSMSGSKHNNYQGSSNSGLNSAGLGAAVSMVGSYLASHSSGQNKPAGNNSSGGLGGMISSFLGNGNSQNNSGNYQGNSGYNSNNYGGNYNNSNSYNSGNSNSGNPYGGQSQQGGGLTGMIGNLIGGGSSSNQGSYSRPEQSYNNSNQNQRPQEGFGYLGSNSGSGRYDESNRFGGEFGMPGGGQGHRGYHGRHLEGRFGEDQPGYGPNRNEGRNRYDPSSSNDNYGGGAFGYNTGNNRY